MIPNERPTPLTKLIMDNVSISIRADTREQSLAHKEEAEREIATLERSLAERTEERDKWANVAAQYSAEREHNANMALAYKAERDTALAKLAKCRDETYRAQTEALVLQAQLAGYLLSIAASDPRNETIFTTIDKLLAALGIPPARQTLEETK